MSAPEIKLDSIRTGPNSLRYILSRYAKLVRLDRPIGILLLLWLLTRAMRGHFTPTYYGPIDYAALYWHLVDLIWIYLFPLLYLIN